MRRLTRARFAVTLALLPATATVMGLAILGQVPSIADGGGIALVIAAIVATAGDGATGRLTDPGGRSVQVGLDADSRPAAGGR